MSPPPTERPRGESVTKNSKKLPSRRASKEALRRKSIVIENDFHGSGVNFIGSCPFLQSPHYMDFALPMRESVQGMGTIFRVCTVTED
jgi:hypothetical protein